MNLSDLSKVQDSTVKEDLKNSKNIHCETKRNASALPEIQFCL
jgi:hypothetical protein